MRGHEFWAGYGHVWQSLLDGSLLLSHFLFAFLHSLQPPEMCKQQPYYLPVRRVFFFAVDIRWSRYAYFGADRHLVHGRLRAGACQSRAAELRVTVPGT